MSTKPILAIGSDHAGYEYKEILRGMLADEGYEVINFGTDSSASVDYPDFVHPVCDAMGKGNAAVGILLCGSANGVAMAANRHKHIRAAVCWDTEIAHLSRAHNDANVICLPCRFVAIELAHEMVEEFLKTPFEGGRHQRRVEKIECV
jgi:ribose 5-phosphate isomerase B